MWWKNTPCLAARLTVCLAESNRLLCTTSFGRCLFFLLLLCACGREERKVQRSFYYWKTVFDLSPKELQTLQQLSMQTLYVKFFDVDWDETTASAKPVAKSIFAKSPPKNLSITPVVFITQEPLQYLAEKGLDSLAANLASMLSSIAATNKLFLSHEIQLDCDWTAATKDKYFYLLQRLKQQPFFQGKIISATIRLHQLKFISQNGVPPVDKGLLMCYNMGNLRYPQTDNSIIDEDELKKYISKLNTYPLPLDVALPVFDWWVLFEGDAYKGLVRDFTPANKDAKKNRIDFAKDTVINAREFKAGQWLRHETSNAETVKRCAGLISEKLKAKELAVILYHLDEQNLTKYTLHELESFYNSLR